MAQYKLVGVYRIQPTLESISAAASYHKHTWLLDDDGRFTEPIIWEHLTNLGLVELQAFGEFSPVELAYITQNGQSPYLEFYLDPVGTALLSEAEAVTTADRRVCFFLHFVDTSAALLLQAQTLTLPPMSELPARLAPYAHYVPVD